MQRHESSKPARVMYAGFASRRAGVALPQRMSVGAQRKQPCQGGCDGDPGDDGNLEPSRLEGGLTDVENKGQYEDNCVDTRCGD